MVESPLGVPFHFTVEFLGFLVTAGGALVVLARTSLTGETAYNRASAALGLAVLAAAQVVHGGSFVESDAGEPLVAMRTLGFALLFLSLATGIREQAAAVAAFGLREPVATAPAGAALLLAVVSLAALRRGGPAALRRLAVAAILLGASELFLAFAQDVRFVSGVVDGPGYAAHLAKLAGYVALASWLWVGVRSSVRMRFVGSFALLLVVVVLALSAALSGVISSTIEQEELKRLSGQLGEAVAAIERERTSALREDVKQIAAADSIKQALTERRDLPALARELQRRDELFTMDFIVFMSPRRRLLAYDAVGPVKSQNGRKVQTSLPQVEVLKVAGSRVTGEVAEGMAPVGASLDVLGDDLIAVIAAARVSELHNPSRVVGTVAIGRWLDVATMEELSGQMADASLLAVPGDRVVASDLRPGFPARILLPTSVRNQVGGGASVARRRTFGSTPHFAAFTQLESPGGVPVGILMLSSRADVVTTTREEVTRALFLVAMAIGGLVLVLAWLSARRITRPIQALTNAAQAVREGDFTIQAKVSGEDEVGELGETFNEMTASLSRMTDELRQRAREEQHLRARIEGIIESMADGLVAVDRDGRILAYNRQAERLIGIPASSAIGERIENVLDVRDAEDRRVSLPVYDLAAGSVSSVWLAGDGRRRTAVAVVSAVLGGAEGEPAGGVAILRDVSREHEVERMKSEFLSNISHELRTPLTPIKGYAEILMRENLPRAKVKRFVSGIRDGTARLERIVALLVDFAAMEAGRLAPRAKPVDLGPLVRELADEWGERSPRHQLIAEVAERLPKVLGDERLLRRSLEELLDNALKFSPDGGTVRVVARGGVAGNGRRRRSVELVVSDEGIGIAPEDVPKIFSDFRQLDGSDTRVFTGLGLGLAYVQRIVEAHQGAVRVDSEPNRGTRLTITIPARG